jgi:hypothetical protein
MSVLKNFRAVTLLWVLPMYAVQGLIRLVTNILGRHFDRVGQMLRAWGWNLLHLPGTVRRRARAQAVRHTGDRDIAQFMAPAGTGLRRWALRASAALVARGEAHAEEDEEPEIQPLRRRVRSLVAAHPAGFGLLAALILTGSAAQAGRVPRWSRWESGAWSRSGTPTCWGGCWCRSARCVPRSRATEP